MKNEYSMMFSYTVIEVIKTFLIHLVFKFYIH